MTANLRFKHVGTVGSTNDIALAMARCGEPEGLVITADQQLSGRGRRGRLWKDEPGECILMSVILRPSVSVSDLSKLAFVASLAVAEWLQGTFGLEALVKWPNDVLVGSRKIAGILVELAQSQQGYAAVVGMGINVNQREFPESLCGLATSVRIETGATHAVLDMAASMASHVMDVYERFLSAGPEEIVDQWRKYMWGIGGSVEIATESRTLAGEIRGVDCAGALLIADAEGIVHAIHAADTIKTTKN